MYRSYPSFIPVIPPAHDLPPVAVRLHGLESWAADLALSWATTPPALREIAVEAFAACVDQLRADVRAGAG